jgi:hypothetical protein
VSTPDAKAVLRGFLDRHRAALVRAVTGLADQQATSVRMPSGTTLVGIVSHVAWMERWWFEATFAGVDVTFPWTDDDPDADWRPGPSEDVAAVVERYRAAVQRSNEIIETSALDDPARGPDLPPFPIGTQDLRWIITHMIEETAQHVGHAEILRELTPNG